VNVNHDGGCWKHEGRIIDTRAEVVVVSTKVFSESREAKKVLNTESTVNMSFRERVTGSSASKRSVWVVFRSWNDVARWPSGTRVEFFW